jgi:hypothetical protein
MMTRSISQQIAQPSEADTISEIVEEEDVESVSVGSKIETTEED